jgi:methyl-accepting chemotaxis protein
MEKYKFRPSASAVTDSTVSGLRKRILIVIALSTLVVAAAFGISFYFAFISSGSAIARQIPQLTPVVEKLKSQLLINTFGLVIIIVASVFFLNRLIVNRIFSNLGRVGSGMHEISEGILPERGGIDPEEGFNSVVSSYNTMLSGLRRKEAREIDKLEECLRISGPSGSADLEKAISELIVRKKGSLNSELRNKREEEKSQNENNRGIFLQPS